MSAKKSTSLTCSMTAAIALFGVPVANDEAALDALLERAAAHGVPGLVIDQPGSIAQLAIAIAARRQVPVAYVPGLVMRRAADLYPGEAKTDRRDAYVLADTAAPAAARFTGWTRRATSCWRSCGSSTASTSTGRRSDSAHQPAAGCAGQGVSGVGTCRRFAARAPRGARSWPCSAPASTTSPRPTPSQARPGTTNDPSRLTPLDKKMGTPPQRPIHAAQRTTKRLGSAVACCGVGKRGST